MLGKSQVWVGTMPSVQPPLQKYVFGTSGQILQKKKKKKKIDTKVFWSSPMLLEFLLLFQIYVAEV